MARPHLEHERALGLERAEQMLKGVLIPPRPSTLVQVLELQHAADPDLDRLAALIGSDVALAAGTLKVVNSPFFGLPRRVSSIPHAVRLLGPNNIVSIITGLMLHSAFEDGRGAFMDRFWAMAERRARIAAHTARIAGGCEAHEAYLVGLFADCGIPVLARRFKNYPEILRAGQSTTDSTVTEYEDQHLGTDHTLAGYLVARSWKLPDSFCVCILRHHDAQDHFTPETFGAATRLLAVLVLAMHVDRELSGTPESCEWRTVGPAVEAYLGVASERVLEEAVTLLAAEVSAP